MLTQFVGLYVIHAYTPTEKNEQTLPFGLEIPEDETAPNLLSIIISFCLAFALIFILMKYRWKFIIRAWFFFVVTLALALAINALIKNQIVNASLVALAFSLPLAYFKIFKPNFFVHNITELLIYPGIAAVFVPILSPLSSIILLILISFYDMWAVWRSGVMQRMAKFQMEELKIFGGFLIPSASKKIKDKIKRIKERYKDKKMPKKVKNQKFKINLAILGGGDVVFPIITAGVFLRAFGILPAMLITFGALAGLTVLFFLTKKDRAYPAMPYITTGIFAGMILGKLLGCF